MIQTPFNLDAGPTASATKKMSSATSFRSPFLHPPLKLSSSSSTSSQPHSFSFKRSTNQRFPHLIKSELDQNTVVAVAVGVVSVAVGLGIPIFYESQIDNAAKRENTQPCFPCNGTGAQSCRFCTGSGNVTVELGGGEKEVSKCINCDGAGALTCTTCQGSGIQPRYLDRRYDKTKICVSE
ncbi:hypothetical protein R6Q59_037154 [Mikania micrantha]